jgi:predicted GNAT family acetyltransferase
MLGMAGQDWQLTVLGTRLTGKVQEWYMCNVESSTEMIQAWNLETAILSLQHRFLPTLMHRHAMMDFDAVRQGNGTVQELYNLMIKLAE